MASAGSLKEALVLAGGLGRRLSRISGDRPKYLLEINGVPLIMYPMLTLYGVGVERFVVVVAEAFLDSMRRRLSPIERLATVEYVANPKPELENGYSLRIGADVMGEVFIATVADHLYTGGLVLDLVETRLGDAAAIICGDPAPLYVDIGEATKILASGEGKLLLIGKGLSSYTHIDTGLFIFRRSGVLAAGHLELLSKSNISSFLQGISKEDSVIVATTWNHLWIDIDTPTDLERLFSVARKVLDSVSKEVLSLID